MLVLLINLWRLSMLVQMHFQIKMSVDRVRSVHGPTRTEIARAKSRRAGLGHIVWKAQQGPTLQNMLNIVKLGLSTTTRPSPTWRAPVYLGTIMEISTRPGQIYIVGLAWAVCQKPNPARPTTIFTSRSWIQIPCSEKLVTSDSRWSCFRCAKLNIHTLRPSHSL